MRTPGRIGSHPPIGNHLIHAQLQTTRRRSQRLPRSILPRTAWGFQPHSLSADRPGLMETARGASWPSCQVRGLTALGEDMVSCADKKSFYISTTPRPRDENGDPPGRNLPAGCGNHNPTGWLLSHGANARRALPFSLTSRLRSTRGRYGLIAAYEIFPHLCDSNNTGTETEVPVVEPAQHGVETSAPLTDR